MVTQPVNTSPVAGFANSPGFRLVIQTARVWLSNSASRFAAASLAADHGSPPRSVAANRWAWIQSL